MAVSCVMVWCSSARETLSLQVGQGQDSSIGLKSLACLLSSEDRNDKSASMTQTFREMDIILRLMGPICVNATPNLAVRVGKTQSAWEY